MLDYESEKLSKEKKEERRLIPENASAHRKKDELVELIPSPFPHPSLQLVGQIPL